MSTPHIIAVKGDLVLNRLATAMGSGKIRIGNASVEWPQAGLKSTHS